jgi:hypothetical protein
VALGDRIGEMRGPDHDRFHLTGGRHEGGGSQRIGERLRCNSCHKLRLFLDEHAFERDVVPECARADMLQSLRRPNPSCAPETRAARPLWTTRDKVIVSQIFGFEKLDASTAVIVIFHAEI